MKADRSSMVTAFPPNILPARWGAAFSQVSAWLWLPVLAAVLTLASGCRSVRPPPAGAMGGSPAGEGGSGGGSGGRAGSGGGGGSGGNSGPDANPPDVTMDTMTIEVPPPCGNSGQACCPGNDCKGGGCCELGTCTPFGNSCRLIINHSCLNNRCGAECGGLKMRCCPQRNCTEKLTICEGGGTGTCEACGGMGQPCCAGNFCAGSVMCMAGRCGPLPMPDAGSDAPRDAPRDTPVDMPRG